jgi:hypothetical protein
MADGDDRKSALIAQLAAQRTRLSQHSKCVQESLDVSRRVKASFAANRLPWLAGAAFAGIVIARLRPRKSAKTPAAAAPLRSAARAGFAWPMAKLLFDLARPALVSMLTARIADFASARTAGKRGRP